MNLYKHARKYIDVKDLRRLHKEKIKKRNIAEKKKQQEIILDELKKNEMKTSPKFSNWRKELQESEWFPIPGSGPTNSASQSFEYGGEGGPRFTANGLGGQDVYPQNIDFFGDQIPTPSYSNLALQGYAPLLQMQKRGNQTEDERIDAEIRKLQEQIKQLDQKISNLSLEQKEFEPEYTGMTQDQYLDRKEEINKKWAEKTSSLRQSLNFLRLMMRSKSASESELIAAFNKYYAYDDARMKELAALDAEYKSQIDSHAKAVDAHSILYAAKINSANQKQDALRAKIVELEKQRPINQQLDASQEAYPNLPFMGARVQSAAGQPSFNYDPSKTPFGADAFMGERSAAANAEKQELAKAEAQRRREAAAPEPAPEPAPESAPIPILDYGVNIARSIAANKPIRIPQSKIPQSEIDKLVQGISNSPGTLYRIPINTKEEPYSDENIYELPNGEVRTHTAGTKARYGNNTMHVDLNDLGHFGNINPLAAAGQAQLQIVKPEDGEPYLVYTDHAYRNLTSTDPGEGSYNPLVGAADWVVHTVLGKNDPNKPNTGAMANYPPNIKGDVRKQIRVPYSQLTQMIKHHINFPGRKKRKKKP
tara:strand:- start:276 stop:2054 length:1779 start_codon:yes stop_codon:yes gene_type:complete